jgi:hypothetical protein
MQSCWFNLRSLVWYELWLMPRLKRVRRGLAPACPCSPHWNKHRAHVASAAPVLVSLRTLMQEDDHGCSVGTRRHQHHRPMLHWFGPIIPPTSNTPAIHPVPTCLHTVPWPGSSHAAPAPTTHPFNPYTHPPTTTAYPPPPLTQPVHQHFENLAASLFAQSPSCRKLSLGDEVRV